MKLLRSAGVVQTSRSNDGRNSPFMLRFGRSRRWKTMTDEMQFRQLYRLTVSAELSDQVTNFE